MECNRDCFNCIYDDCINDRATSRHQREYSRAYYQAHREKYLEYFKQYRERRKDYYRDYIKIYNQNEEVRERKRRYMREKRKGVTNMHKCHRDSYIDTFIGKSIKVLDYNKKWHRGLLKCFTEGRYVLDEGDHDFAFRKSHIKKIERIGA